MELDNSLVDGNLGEWLLPEAMNVSQSDAQVDEGTQEHKNTSFYLHVIRYYVSHAILSTKGKKHMS